MEGAAPDRPPVPPAVDRPDRRTVEVLAQLVASVVRVPVVAGQQVAQGETLVVVESMKMEIPVAAPAAGRLREVLVAPADVVEEGDVLAVIDVEG